MSKTYLSEEIKKAIESVKELTERRKAYFKLYFNFVLDNDQWYNAELDELSSKEISAQTFNHSEDYFEEYLSYLFPRNPQTGIMEIGVSVLKEEKQNRSKYEEKILSEYENNCLTDILLEQGQNFLIGGAGCLYYPPNDFGGVDILSVDPKNVYLGWKSGKLDWFAFFDEDSKTYNFINKKISVILNEQFQITESFANKFGFIPFSWIPNMPKAHTREGRTKIASLFNLDRSYNKAMTSFNKRVEENTDPHRVIYSDTADEKKIKRGKGKTTVLSSSDKMEYLELKEGAELLNYSEKLENKIKSKTALVDSGGAVKSALSGVSLSFQYSGMLNRIAFMRVYWDQAFKDLNNAILHYAFGDKKSRYLTRPVYNSAMNYDESQRVEDICLQVDKKLISRRDAIDFLRGGENADEKLEEIFFESEKYKFDEKEITNFNNNKLTTKN